MGNITLSRRVGIISQGGGGNRVTRVPCKSKVESLFFDNRNLSGEGGGKNFYRIRLPQQNFRS